jgi:FAD/FMN-containing dehydrogenase
MTALDLLRRGFSGQIIEPGHPAYDDARRTGFDIGEPAYVVRPRDVRDVRAAVRFAAETGLPLAVRGGGHGFAGFATNDGGVVMDLALLTSVNVVDVDRRLVRVGGGATWGQVATALAEQRLAISSGDTAGVGVGGLTLSGGIGWKVRKYGLALDSLVGAEVVTAAGDVVHASVDEHPELFWALRGGGGNFGVVTAFEFVAQPTTKVFHGKITFPAAETETVLTGWADHLRSAPDDLTSIVNLPNTLAGPERTVQVHVTFDGDDHRRAQQALDPIRRLGTVLEDDVAPTPYADILVESPEPPPGLQFLCRSAFVDAESARHALQVLAEASTWEGSPLTQVRSVGGAIARVADAATAYAHRRAELLVVTMTAGPGPVVEAARPVLDRLWTLLAPHVHGAYANFLTGTGEAEVSAVYPPATRERLAQVKRRYDPENLFAANHNIRPAHGKAA